MTIHSSSIPDPDELDEQIEVQVGRRAPFTQIGDWILLSGASDRAVALYTRLAMHINVQRGDTAVWPAQEVLAEWADFSKVDSITPYADELVALGAITVEKSNYANGMRARNRYIVHQTPPQGYHGPLSVAEYYALRRTKPTELANWRAERRDWLAVQVKAMAAHRKEEAARRKAAKKRPAELPARTPLQRGTAQPAEMPDDALFSVPRSNGVRTPLQRESVPRSSGVEQDEVKPDEALSPRLPRQQAVKPAAAPQERETPAAPNNNQTTAAQRAIRATNAVPRDQEQAFIAWITTKHTPRGPGWWRTATGDLPELADLWRAETSIKPGSAASALPAACTACLDADPAAEFNPKFRLHHGKPCPACHPNAVPAAA